MPLRQVYCRGKQRPMPSPLPPSAPSVGPSSSLPALQPEPGRQVEAAGAFNRKAQ